MPYPKGFQLTEGEKKRLADEMAKAAVVVLDTHTTEPVKFELETRDLSDVPIFAAGTWTSSGGNKRTWTEDDLDEIAVNAAKLTGTLTPFLRVDHTDEKTHKRITGRFKIGDLTNVRRIGAQLVADIVRIPKKAYELMKAGVFGRPSAEIVPEFTDEGSGKKFGKVLWGAAILSGKHPAVTTLDDVYNLFGMAPDVAVPAGYEFTAANAAELFEQVEVDNEEVKEGGVEMTPEEVKAQVDAAVAKAKEEAKAEFEAGNKPIADELAALKKARVEQDAAKFETDYAALVEKGKKDAKIIPSQEVGLKKMVDAWKATSPDTALAEFAAYIDAQPVAVQTHEAGTQGDPKDKVKGGEVKVAIPRDVQEYMKREGIEMDSETAELDAKVREVQSKHRLTYEQALTEVTGAGTASEPSPRDGVSPKVQE
jgi:hypothetical protein